MTGGSIPLTAVSVSGGATVVGVMPPTNDE